MNDFTEFAPATGVDMEGLRNQGFGMVRYGPGDDRKIVLFYNKAVPNPRKSQAQGRPIHENQIYVKIGEPGETNLNMIDRPAHDGDRARWPRHWAQFQNNQQQVPEGTPIEMLFPNNPALAASMKSYGVHTIEQLANLSASGISTVGMGAQEWVNKAKSYLEKSDKGVAFHKLNSELADRDTKISVLENTVNALREQLDAAISRMNAAAGPQQMPMPREQWAEQPFDAQTAMINNVPQRDFTLPATAFSSEITDQPKRRGRPPRIKETA